MKIPIIYQRPLRGQSCNIHVAGGIDVQKEVRVEGLHGATTKNMEERTHVFRVPGNGEYELDVTPHNMEWLASRMVRRPNKSGTRIFEPSWALKYEQDIEQVRRFVPNFGKDVEEADFEEVEEPILPPVAKKAPAKKRPGRPKKAVAKPRTSIKADEAAIAGSDG